MLVFNSPERIHQYGVVRQSWLKSDVSFVLGISIHENCVGGGGWVLLCWEKDVVHGMVLNN